MKKTILMILDGWGRSPDPKISAIDNANVPFINSLYKNYPSAELRTDGLNVGLPDGQMGNSEVGHMNLGAGRIVYQDLAKINLAVQNHTFLDEKIGIDQIAFSSPTEAGKLFAQYITKCEDFLVYQWIILICIQKIVYKIEDAYYVL